MTRVDFNARDIDIAFLKEHDSLNLTSHIRLAIHNYIRDIKKAKLNVSSSPSQYHEHKK